MDLLLPAARNGEKNHLYMNQAGAGFTEAGGAWRIADNDAHAAVTSAVFFDDDNDGRPDVYLTGMGCSRLLHNTGQTFEDVSAASAPGIRSTRTTRRSGRTTRSPRRR
ncbi:MAG: hypothetical protein LAO77_15500 [Acidobacteriia bacterium]|nr:hypothetical protein [Terriglobia bacterium]